MNYFPRLLSRVQPCTVCLADRTFSHHLRLACLVLDNTINTQHHGNTFYTPVLIPPPSTTHHHQHLHLISCQLERMAQFCVVCQTRILDKQRVPSLSWV